MKTKLFMIFFVIFLTTGIVVALDDSDFDFPDGFQHVSDVNYETVDNYYYSEDNSSKIHLMDYDSFYDDYLGQVEATVSRLFPLSNEISNYDSSIGENLYEYQFSPLDEYGILEVVNKDDHKYIVTFSSEYIDLDNDYNRLIEFNKLNNLTPIKCDSIY